MRSRIHRKGRRNKPLSEREKQGNKIRVEYGRAGIAAHMASNPCQSEECGAEVRVGWMTTPDILRL